MNGIGMGGCRLVFALCAALAGLPAAAAPLSDCVPGPARSETVAGVGPRGEIRFASGGRAVLASLRWPGEEATSRDWLAAWAGRRILVVPRGEPDRWGRERIDALTEEGAVDLAGDAIAAGLAYADAGEAEALCRPALRLVEATARARRLGIWQEAPPTAEDGPALRRLAGLFAVVEGRIRHVGERGARTYLDFVPKGADGLTVVVAKRHWRRMAERGLTAASLLDRRVRVRGLVEVWRGPTIEAGTPDAIETLDDESPVPQEGTGPEDSGVRR
jgi:hypothetical protein